MKAICVESLFVEGFEVFVKGNVYELEEIYEGKKTTSYKMRSEYGVGVYSKKDALLKKHFKKEGDFGFKKLSKEVNK